MPTKNTLASVNSGDWSLTLNGFLDGPEQDHCELLLVGPETEYHAPGRFVALDQKFALLKQEFPAAPIDDLRAKLETALQGKLAPFYREERPTA